MKIHLRHGLVLGTAVLVTIIGCPTEPLTREEYTCVKRVLRREFLSEESLTDGARLESGYESRLKQAIVDIPRRLCRSQELSFRAFDKAHERFGRKGLSYTRESKEFLRLFLGSQEDNKGKTDSAQIERIYRLAFDLGLPIPDAFLPIEVTKEGEVLIHEEFVSESGEVRNLMQIEDRLGEYSFYVVQLLFDPQAYAASLFKIAGAIPSAEEFNISDSLYNPLMVMVFPEISEADRKTPCIAQRYFDLERALASSDLTVFLEISKTGEIKLNSEPVTSEARLRKLIEALLDRSLSKILLISPSDSVRCGELVRLTKLAQTSGKPYIVIVQKSYIKGKEPRIETEKLLALTPIVLRRGLSVVLVSKSPFEKIAEMVEPDEEKIPEGKSGFAMAGDLIASDIVTGVFPAYPSWAKEKGLKEVTMTIQFNVDEEGNVDPNMIIRNSTGYPSWDREVKKALARWRFKPAQVSRRIAVITFTFI